MITRPTVLVLGAGASVPYHFPTGETLFERLTATETHVSRPDGGSYQLSSAAAQVLHHGLSDAATLHTFTERLARSGASSVDQFLAHQPPELVEIGKLVMAAELARWEWTDNLHQRAVRDEGPWYRELWKQLDNRPGRLLRNQLTVITFNYDRSLEAFIADALQHLHNVPVEEAHGIANAFPIVHVHGQLGSLSCDSETGRAYLPAQTPEQLQKAAAGIRVISEIGDGLDTFAKARHAMSNAQRVYFLGFGYDPASLSRLGFEPGLRMPSATVGGSVFRMTPAQVLEASLAFADVQFTPGDSRHRVLDYLRHIPRLDG